MKKKRNITFSLPEELINKAKVEAAKNKESLNQLVKESIENRLYGRRDYDRAMKKHLKSMEEGFDLGTGGKIELTREQIHERG